jgi:hypothetical protein
MTDLRLHIQSSTDKRCYKLESFSASDYRSEVLVVGLLPAYVIYLQQSLMFSEPICDNAIPAYLLFHTNLQLVFVARLSFTFCKM